MYEFSNQTPIYIQIIENVKKDIIKGIYTVGGKIPSVREFSCKYEVNPNTIVKALNELENCGLIITDRTNGKFVTKDQDVIKRLKDKSVLEIKDKFFKELEDLGIDKETAIKLIKE